MTLNDHPKPKKRAFIYHGVAGLADFHDDGMEGEGVARGISIIFVAFCTHWLSKPKLDLT